MSSKQVLGQGPNFYERDLVHNESSIMTAAGDSGIDGGPSIALQEHSLMIGSSATMDSMLAKHAGGASVRHIPTGKYLT